MWIRALLAVAVTVGVAAWWHADDFAQARYEHQVAARQCYKAYDAPPAGLNSISSAEANVDACYDARLADYHRTIAEVSWATALGAGMLAAGAAWGAISLAGRWRRAGRT